MAAPIRVCIAGACGNVAYALLPRVAKGDIFGKGQPLILSLLTETHRLEKLNGICMELADCAYPLLTEVIPTNDPQLAFKDTDAVFLLGSRPSREGGERKDLLISNVRIFLGYGTALNTAAKDTVKVLVVSNPANTNALVCSHSAPNIPKDAFSCLTRLDQNRAQALIASYLGVATTAVKNVIVWGNHSLTQFPDVSHATVRFQDKEMAVTQAIDDDYYIKHHFIPAVQKRGDEVFRARKQSSVMSAAKAAADHMRDWWFGTEGRWVSMGVFSKGEYGIPEGLMYSFPVTIANKTVTIVPDLHISDFAQEKMDLSAKELLEEKAEAESHYEER